MTCSTRALALRSSLAFALVALGGCQGAAVLPVGTLGVPDPTSGPSTDDDIDGDGVANERDNCPSLANADQREVCAYEYPPETTGDPVEDGLARLNFWRAQLGLNTVTEDEALSAGCAAHLRYLQRLSAELGSPQLAHFEDLARPYATLEGQRAGLNSVLSLGMPSMGGAVDGWLATLYHRLPLIHPGLQRVGIAYAADGRYACLEYRTGTDASARAPHPILWPAPDIQIAELQFPGAESPCPTVSDPLGPEPCPASATIPTLGIHRWGSLSGVSGTFTRLDTMEVLPLLAIYYDRGPSAHEQMGYLEGTVALVPAPGTELTRAPYEVRVDAQLDGRPTTWRWRFHTRGNYNPDLPCELWDQGNFDDAIDVTAASVEGRVCAQPDFFRIRNAGSWRVSLEYDPRSPLDLVVYDATRAETQRASEGGNTLVLEDVPGMSFVEVRSRSGRMGPYVIRFELN
jgi:hypothetical protein